MAVCTWGKACVNVVDIQEKIRALDLLSNHAICGCDSVSVLFGKGKRTVLHKVKKSLGNISYIEAFINTDNKKEDIAGAGERFLITLYWGHSSIGELSGRVSCLRNSGCRHCPGLLRHSSFIHSFLPHIPHSHCSNGVETTCLLLTGAGHSLQENGQLDL